MQVRMNMHDENFANKMLLDILSPSSLLAA